ncbi:alanine aminotransferase 2 [Salmo trutta]|uniref:alanine aminotransferase 2 n=1 Tax=Salmo trutta TaxID=8032 RepID=UPI0011320FE9|nr:alanine aminotransferase 2-like [Salmo trutta]
MLVHNQASLPTGVLTAVPAYSYFKMMLQRLGAAVVPYYLDEEQGWAMEVEELRRALQASKGVCNPVALYVINPGNPTGHVQSRKCIEEVIRFTAEERLFLMADEVYQESMFREGEFVSYKKVLSEMGPLSHSGAGLFPLSIQRLHGRETQSIQAMLVHNMNWVPEVLNNIPGISC